MRAVLPSSMFYHVCSLDCERTRASCQELICIVEPPPVEVGWCSLQFRRRRRTPAFHTVTFRPPHTVVL